MDELTREQLVDVIRNELTESDAEILAGRLADVFWEAMRYRALPDAKQHVRTRYLSDGQPITSDGTTTVGLGSNSIFDTVNYEGGNVTIESRLEGRRINVVLGSGGIFCHDYLVDAEWADKVTAGQGTEGQTIATMTGHTFRVYSTLDGAFGHIDTLTGIESVSVGICPGAYGENLTLPTAGGSKCDAISIVALGQQPVHASGPGGFAGQDGVYITGSITYPSLPMATEWVHVSFYEDVLLSGGEHHQFRQCSLAAGDWTISSGLGPVFDYCDISPVSFTVSTSSSDNMRITKCWISTDLTITGISGGEGTLIEGSDFSANSQLLLGDGTDGSRFIGNRWISNFSASPVIISGSNPIFGLVFDGNTFPRVNATNTADIDITNTSTVSLTVDGNTFPYTSTGGTSKYFIRGAADSEVILACVGNTFEPRTDTPTFFEDDGGVSIQAKLIDSVIGPNVPSNFNVELLAGSSNVLYLGTGTVSGAGSAAAITTAGIKQTYINFGVTLAPVYTA